MNLINLFLLPDHRIIENDYCLAILIIVICVVYLQLRSSFKQAFSKKKTNKPQSSHEEFEEMTDSSLPSSPKLQHTDRQTSTTQPLCSSPSTTEWVQTRIYTVLDTCMKWGTCINICIFVVFIYFVFISITNLTCTHPVNKSLFFISNFHLLYCLVNLLHVLLRFFFLSFLHCLLLSFFFW